MNTIFEFITAVCKQQCSTLHNVHGPNVHCMYTLFQQSIYNTTLQSDTSTMHYRIHTQYFIMFPFVFRDEYLAYKAALFFCINPSSVLFTSPMTLSLLAASSFTALASIENGMGLFSGAYLAVASATHPSALLGLLMVLYNSMRQVATQTILLVSKKQY